MSLSTIRDLLIVIGIYLYFIAWVYLHAYYESFGISTESLKLDYSSYLVFSYNVIASHAFVVFAGCILGIILLGWVAVEWLTRKMLKVLKENNKKRIGLIKEGRRFINAVKPVVMGLAMVLLFPVLFGMARDTALTNYAADRTNTGQRHRIQFIFREGAGYAKQVAIPDSANTNPVSQNYHLQLLSNDNGRTLRYLGETDQYFIVLHQSQYPDSPQLPEGAIYYIDKKDVLLSHIILSSR